MRSIRVSSQLSGSLSREARSKRVSVNALVSSVLEKYDEWDRMAEKFGFIQIPSDLFKLFLSSLDAEKLIEVAKEAGRTLPKECILFWFKEVSYDNFVRYLGLQSEFQFQNQLLHHEVTTSRGKVTIVLHHLFGESGSIWFLNYLSEAIRTNLGITPTADKTSNSVRLEFPFNPSEPRFQDG
ncbi:MAG: hypothetical protein ACRD6W_04805 [Nitrososphaerales archaeon]